MSDISKVQVGEKTYNVKDANAIPNNKNSDVTALVNFLNGLKVAGNYVISSAQASATSIDADAEATVVLTVTQDGVAEFAFGIPKNKVTYCTLFKDGKLVFDDETYAHFTTSSLVITHL